MLFYSTTREETSIIFAWKLFINLPVKHSIEPFTSYYRNLLGIYWQLSKYLHKALKHLVPSEGKKLLHQAENYPTPFPLPFPLFYKGKLPSSTPLICLNYTSTKQGREKNGNSCILEKRKNSISRTTCKPHHIVSKSKGRRKGKTPMKLTLRLSFSCSSLRNFCSSLSKIYRASSGTQITTNCPNQT